MLRRSEVGCSVEALEHLAKRLQMGFLRVRSPSFLLCLACFALFIPAVCLSGAAQGVNAALDDNASGVSEEGLLSSYVGQNVDAIAIAGRPGFGASQCPQCFVQRAGQPFSTEKVVQTASALKAAGKFSRVEIQAEPDADGVRVTFVVRPAVYFGIFEFPGAGRFPYSQLIQAANYPFPEAFNPSEVNADRQSLVNFFRQEGYFGAEAGIKLDLDSAHAIANVQFDSTLGKRAKFGSVDVESAPDHEGSALANKLTTWPARFRGAGVRPGKTFHHSTLNHAEKYLQGALEKQGYLGAQVKLSGAEYVTSTNRANILFETNPGEKTRVQIEGSHLWPWTRKSLLPMYQGVSVDDETVNEGRQALISYFQAKGFFDVAVDSQLNKAAKTETVIYKITKGKKHKVTAISLTGNTTLPSSRLNPQITVEKKHLLSPGKFSDQLVQASIKNLKAVYQSEGFSDVQVTSAVARTEGNVEVTFRVVEGPRDTVNSLAIEGARTLPQSQFAPGGLKLAVGQAYSQAHVQSDRAGILANYLKAGYLNASFREEASTVSKSDPHHINVVYHIVEGPRVTTGNVLTLGRQHTRQRLINQDIAEIQKGQPLTESELLVSGSKLYDHRGVFDWAEVDPKEPVTTQTTDDVLVKVHEAKRNEFTYGFGFEVIDRGGSIPSGTVALPSLPPIGLPSNFSTSETTFYGPRGTVQYTRNNLWGKGESLSFTGFAGRLDQRGAAYYIDPNLRWTPWKATTSLSYEKNEENPIFSSQEEQATEQFQHALGKEGKTTFFTQYGFSQVDLTRILIPSLVPAQDQHIRLSTISANLTRDTRDNPLDEHRGSLQSLELDFNTSKLGSSVDFAKLTGQAAIYRQKFHNIVWAESIRIGLAEPFSNSFVPLSEAFFTGGGNSLRGYPLDGAGPQRKIEACSSGGGSACTLIQVPNGGNELLLLNSEARIPLAIKKGLSFAAFYDGGNVFPYAGFHDFTSLYSNNVGVGLRYSTPVGPIRVDIGRNLNPIQGINATQYFVGIGQAF
jgi:outer membrane protein insertion porin family